MSEQEMMERIKELEKENAKLRGRKKVNILPNAMSAQAELDFLFPYYHPHNGGRWMRSSSYSTAEFAHMRNLVKSVVDQVNEKNIFTSQQIKDLSPEDFLIVVNCADELAKVLAKYKKRYLESVGREDIVKAFNM